MGSCGAGENAGFTFGVQRENRFRLFFSAERVPQSDPFGNGAAFADMFGENPFAPLDRDAAVPNAFRIDDEPRTAGADAEALGLRPHDFEAEFPYPALKIIPNTRPLLHRRTLRADAEEKVMAGGCRLRLFQALGDGGIGGIGHQLLSARS